MTLSVVFAGESAEIAEIIMPHVAFCRIIGIRFEKPGNYMMASKGGLCTVASSKAAWAPLPLDRIDCLSATGRLLCGKVGERDPLQIIDDDALEA